MPFSPTEGTKVFILDPIAGFVEAVVVGERTSSGWPCRLASGHVRVERSLWSRKDGGFAWEEVKDGASCFSHIRDAVLSEEGKRKGVCRSSGQQMVLVWGREGFDEDAARELLSRAHKVRRMEGEEGLVAADLWSEVPNHPLASAHPFAFAQRVYECARAGVEEQSIVVSGIAAAGKSRAVKHVLWYLGAASGVDRGVVSEVRYDKGAAWPLPETKGACQAVAVATRLMEAFGHAGSGPGCDSANRSGKYVRFDIRNGVTRRIETRGMMLDEALLVSPDAGHMGRNFNVFYHLLRCGSSQLLAAANFNPSEGPLDFSILANGRSTPAGPSINDSSRWNEFRDALTCVGVTEDAVIAEDGLDSPEGMGKLGALARTLSGLLFLGNVTFKEKDGHELEKMKGGGGGGGGGEEEEEGESGDGGGGGERWKVGRGDGWEVHPLVRAAEALGVVESELSALWLMGKEDGGMGDPNVARDETIKGIYAGLFRWAEAAGNAYARKVLGRGGGERSEETAASRLACNVTVVDLPGLRTFATTEYPASLWQLLSNYTHEKVAATTAGCLWASSRAYFAEQSSHSPEAPLSTPFSAPSPSTATFPAMLVSKLFELKVDGLLQVIPRHTGADALCSRIERKLSRTRCIEIDTSTTNRTFIVKHSGGDVPYDPASFERHDRNEKSGLLRARLAQVLCRSDNPAVKSIGAWMARCAAQSVSVDAGRGSNLDPLLHPILEDQFASWTLAPVDIPETAIHARTSPPSKSIASQWVEQLGALLGEVAASRVWSIACIRTCDPPSIASTSSSSSSARLGGDSLLHAWNGASVARQLAAESVPSMAKANSVMKRREHIPILLFLRTLEPVVRPKADCPASSSPPPTTTVDRAKKVLEADWVKEVLLPLTEGGGGDDVFVGAKHVMLHVGSWKRLCAAAHQRRIHVATLVQGFWRSVRLRRKFRATVWAASVVARVARGFVTRLQFRMLKRNAAARAARAARRRAQLHGVRIRRSHLRQAAYELEACLAVLRATAAVPFPGTQVLFTAAKTSRGMDEEGGGWSREGDESDDDELWGDAEEGIEQIVKKVIEDDEALDVNGRAIRAVNDESGENLEDMAEEWVGRVERAVMRAGIVAETLPDADAPYVPTESWRKRIAAARGELLRTLAVANATVLALEVAAGAEEEDAWEVAEEEGALAEDASKRLRTLFHDWKGAEQRARALWGTKDADAVREASSSLPKGSIERRTVGADWIRAAALAAVSGGAQEGEGEGGGGEGDLGSSDSDEDREEEEEDVEEEEEDEAIWAEERAEGLKQAGQGKADPNAPVENWDTLGSDSDSSHEGAVKTGKTIRLRKSDRAPVSLLELAPKFLKSWEPRERVAHARVAWLLARLDSCVARVEGAREVVARIVLEGRKEAERVAALETETMEEEDELSALLRAAERRALEAEREREAKECEQMAAEERWMREIAEVATAEASLAQEYEREKQERRLAREEAARLGEEGYEVEKARVAAAEEERERSRAVADRVQRLKDGLVTWASEILRVEREKASMEKEDEASLLMREAELEMERRRLEEDKEADEMAKESLRAALLLADEASRVAAASVAQLRGESGAETRVEAWTAQDQRDRLAEARAEIEETNRAVRHSAIAIMAEEDQARSLHRAAGMGQGSSRDAADLATEDETLRRHGTWALLGLVPDEVESMQREDVRSDALRRLHQEAARAMLTGWRGWTRSSSEKGGGGEGGEEVEDMLPLTKESDVEEYRGGERRLMRVRRRRMEQQRRELATRAESVLGVSSLPHFSTLPGVSSAIEAQQAVYDLAARVAHRIARRQQQDEQHQHTPDRPSSSESKDDEMERSMGLVEKDDSDVLEDEEGGVDSEASSPKIPSTFMGRRHLDKTADPSEGRGDGAPVGEGGEEGALLREEAELEAWLASALSPTPASKLPSSTKEGARGDRRGEKGEGGEVVRREVLKEDEERVEGEDIVSDEEDAEEYVGVSAIPGSLPPRAPPSPPSSPSTLPTTPASSYRELEEARMIARRRALETGPPAGRHAAQRAAKREVRVLAHVPPPVTEAPPSMAEPPRAAAMGSAPSRTPGVAFVIPGMKEYDAATRPPRRVTEETPTLAPPPPPTSRASTPSPPSTPERRTHSKPISSSLIPGADPTTRLLAAPSSPSSPNLPSPYARAAEEAVLPFSRTSTPSPPPPSLTPPIPTAPPVPTPPSHSKPLSASAEERSARLRMLSRRRPPRESAPTSPPSVASPSSGSRTATTLASHARRKRYSQEQSPLPGSHTAARAKARLEKYASPSPTTTTTTTTTATAAVAPHHLPPALSRSAMDSPARARLTEALASAAKIAHETGDQDAEFLRTLLQRYHSEKAPLEHE